MSLHTEWLRYGDDAQFSGYFVKLKRASQPAPTVIVIQEIWGVNAHIQDVANRFAKAGYNVFAPDLYAKNGKRMEGLEDERTDEVLAFMETVPHTAWSNPEEREKLLKALSEDQSKRISETFQLMFGGVNHTNYMEQLLKTSQFLREELSATKGRGVASVGYCMGGTLSAQLACHDPALKAAAIYYGSAPQPDQLQGIQCPVVGFYGQLDSRISDAVPALAESMKNAGKSFESYIYKDAHHAFYNDTRSSYQMEAARDSFSRTLQLFNAVLS